MRKDILKLLRERDIDAAVIVGSTYNSPDMYYVTNGAFLSDDHTIAIIKKDGTKYLLHKSFEEENAKKTGFRLIDHEDYPFKEFIKKGYSGLEAGVKRLSKILDDLHIAGKVSFFGRVNMHYLYPLLRGLEEKGKIKIVSDMESSILEEARITKDSNEIKRIKEIAKKSNLTLEEVKNYIKSHNVRENYLVKNDGSPLTVGDVKDYINSRLIRYDLADPTGMIFAIGKDAASPHLAGNPTDRIELGKSIVFDSLPQEKGGGYFFDITRTFCIGSASKEIKKVYDDVLAVQEAVINSFKVGTAAKDYQLLTCKLFREKGYLTLEEDVKLKEGYVHDVGHGLGLCTHEKPYLALASKDRIKPGMVFTVEPGLYFPSKGLGVRIEDVLYCNEKGEFENLTTASKDLIIDVK